MATRKKSSKKSAKKSSKKAAKKTARKPARRTAARKSAKKSGKKRTPSAAFMKPMQPDAALSAVVGSNPMPRTEVVKKIWAYIRRNGLQDSRNKRAINADDKLRPVFGGKSQISMFEMMKMVNRHLS